jgi:hypothetical protein
MTKEDREIISDMLEAEGVESDVGYMRLIRVKALLDIGEQLSRLNDTLERLTFNGTEPAVSMDRTALKITTV